MTALGKIKASLKWLKPKAKGAGEKAGAPFPKELRKEGQPERE